MTPLRARRAIALLVLLVVVAIRPAPAAGASVLRLEFFPTLGGKPLAVPAATGEPIGVSRLDWLVSGLALQRADGSWMEGREWFGALSAAEGRLQVEADGTSAEEFRALRFRVGVDPATDAANPAQWPAGHALNPEVNHLHWGWQGGYVFLALEGRRGTEGVSYHLAREEEPMIVELPVQFRGGGPVTIAISLDVAPLLAAAAGGENSTHSRTGDGLAVRMKKSVRQAFRATGVSYDLWQPAGLAKEAAALPAGTRAQRLAITSRFPQVRLPADNPLTMEGVALGRRLFHDTRLSINGTQSCASCHQQPFAFADPRRFSLGAEGQRGTRNAMPLFNLAWQQDFFWDGRAKSLREQVLVPISDAHEMNERLDRVIAKLTDDTAMAEEFAHAFGSPGVTSERLALALEQFLLTLVSQDSRFDRAARQQAELTEEEKRGLQLFVTEFDPARGLRGADCFHCHGGTLFTDHLLHNNGLALADDDLGRMAVTGNAADRGKFKAPSLRNVALTAPYMHDGRFATLEAVVEHYNSGVQRSTTLDPNLAKHPAAGLQLTAAEQHDLVAFLKTLTDEPFTRADSRPPAADP
jgi:cytochrome c peroxidase